MPDYAQCNPPDLLAAQRSLVDVVDQLRGLDERLRRIRRSVAPDQAHLLSRELPGVIEAVQTDLLRDAIETLESLTTRTEGVVEVDGLGAVDLLERLCRGG